MKFSLLNLPLRPKNQPILFVIAIFLFYFTIPLCVYSYNQDEAFLHLAKLAILSTVVMFFSNIFFKKRYKILSRIPTRVNTFTWIVLTIFCIFVLITTYTSSSIPIFAALSGETANTLSESREQFLKARTGILSALVYLSAILTTTFMPYILILNFSLQKKIRKLILSFFVVYSLLFLSKIFFLKWLFPLGAYFSGDKQFKYNRKRILLTLLISFLLISFNVYIAKFGNILNKEQQYFDMVDYYYSASFVQELDQSSGLKFLIWRAVAVPIFTASDSIKVFNDYYGNIFFKGATNGTLALLLKQERCRFERMVFAYQYRSGYMTNTKSSNSAFFIEAYINFGITGNVLFSVVSSWLLVNFGYSSNPAISAITPILSFSLFTGGLLGVLFGNGIFMFLICYFLFSAPIKKNVYTVSMASKFIPKKK
jgi:hypothetical protein